MSLLLLLRPRGAGGQPPQPAATAGGRAEPPKPRKRPDPELSKVWDAELRIFYEDEELLGALD